MDWEAPLPGDMTGLIAAMETDLKEGGEGRR
jgi:hypothetical protein